MKRPAIITVMGHVDHGKTTLLDALRETNEAERESGGITQHVGASQIEYKGSKITFIDTPGHEAFTQMRARGGKIADIVILVVAADDGVKPQTKEAISHAKAANLPIIVAINKIDVPGANPQRVKGELTKEGIIPEDMGGDTICVEVSAKTKQNIDKLLEAISTVAEFIESKESRDTPLKGYVLESKHDSKKGYIANIILTSGKLKVGEEILIGKRHIAKIRAITKYPGVQVKEIEAGDPAEILGLKEIVEPGEIFEKYAGQKIEEEKKKPKQAEATKGDLNIILRADTQGTLEAIEASLRKLKYEDKTVNIVLSGVGDVKESDVLLAKASSAIILAFKVKVPPIVLDRAKQNKIIVREYSVIYELLEEIEGALEGLLEMEEEKIKGRAIIKKLFPLPSGDIVAGVEVLYGKLKVGDKVSIREEEDSKTEVFKTRIKKLKHGKEDVERIDTDKEGGVLLKNGFEKLQEGYIIEVL